MMIIIITITTIVFAVHQTDIFAEPRMQKEIFYVSGIVLMEELPMMYYIIALLINNGLELE